MTQGVKRTVDWLLQVEASDLIVDLLDSHCL